MAGRILESLFEHNNWANEQVIDACFGLTDEQLDSSPDPGSTWSVRHTLAHLVESQLAYLRLLTLPPEERSDFNVPIDEFRSSAKESGEGLLALARAEGRESTDATLITLDGYEVDAWVVMLQVLNHAHDHRRQLGGMLRALGVSSPSVDGWSFGSATGAARRIEGEGSEEA